MILDYFKEKGYTPEELSSDYKKRDEINIIYFIDLQNNLPKWPWNFKLKKATSLGLI
jgi:hypothetical protein